MKVPPEKSAPPEAGKQKGGDAATNLHIKLSIEALRRASPLTKLTTAQHGWVWQSDGDAIKAAMVEARPGEGVSRG